MAKKVVASLQDKKNKKFAKVFVPVKSTSGFYTYKNSVVFSDDIEKFIKSHTNN